MVLYNKKAPKDGAEFAEKLFPHAGENQLLIMRTYNDIASFSLDSLYTLKRNIPTHNDLSRNNMFFRGED